MIDFIYDDNDVDIGIEFLWARAKKDYRREVDRLKANNIAWDNLGLVQNIIEAILDDFCMA